MARQERRLPDRQLTSAAPALNRSLELGTCTKVKAIRIFGDTLEKINEAYKQLHLGWLHRGEGVPRDKFLELAKTYSNKVADLDWFEYGTNSDGQVFQYVAFSTPARAITAPFRSGDGYHIILVEGRH